LLFLLFFHDFPFIFQPTRTGIGCSHSIISAIKAKGFKVDFMEQSTGVYQSWLLRTKQLQWFEPDYKVPSWRILLAIKSIWWLSLYPSLFNYHRWENMNDEPFKWRRGKLEETSVQSEIHLAVCHY
jgi:hypothetical protein